MANGSPVERARENLTEIVSVIITATWLAALLTGQNWWLAFMLVGYIAIIPLVAVLFGDEDDRAEWWTDKENAAESGRTETADADRRDALQTLRDRYARGDLTEEQFERKLETLLETETLEDVKGRDSVASSNGRSQATTQHEMDPDRTTEPDQTDEPEKSTEPESELERDP